MNGLEKWRHRYDRLGIATIPLRSGSKAPVQKAWQSVPHSQQWQDAGGSNFRGNIGVRLGEGTAIIDADNSLTVSAIREQLAGLGITKASTVQTKRGRHYYVKISGVPADFNYAKLRGGLDGELRAGAGSYCVAPCSMVDQYRYKFINGSPEDLADQRAIRWQDLIELVRPVDQVSGIALTEMPVRLVWRDMPTKAGELLRWLASADKAERYQKYATRSEAEAAVIAMLILAGWQYDEIERIFRASLPGHYTEAGKHKERYLSKTYINVLNELASNIERQDLAEVYQISGSMAWPGRAGVTRLKTVQALLSAGWQWSTYEPEASVRYIAEHGALSVYTVHKALSWLEYDMRLVDRQSIGAGNRGSKYRILPLVNYLSCAKTNNSHSIKSKKMQEDTDTRLQALWSERALSGGIKLGGSGMVVYRWLGAESVTVAELADRTGKHNKTVRQALKRLAGVGLAASAGGYPEMWQRGTKRIDKAAYELGAQVAAKRRYHDHEREREIYREMFTDES